MGVITVCVLIIEPWKEPPSNKRVGIMENERVEQFQPTALDSEEKTTTGEAVQEDDL